MILYNDKIMDYSEREAKRLRIEGKLNNLDGIRNSRNNAVLSAGAGAFLTKYFIGSKKFKNAKEDLINVCMNEEKGVTR